MIDAPTPVTYQEDEPLGAAEELQVLENTLRRLEARIGLLQQALPPAREREGQLGAECSRLGVELFNAQEAARRAVSLSRRGLGEDQAAMDRYQRLEREWRAAGDRASEACVAVTNTETELQWLRGQLAGCRGRIEEVLAQAERESAQAQKEAEKLPKPGVLESWRRKLSGVS
jgi:chromosome segregation ATPase